MEQNAQKKASIHGVFADGQKEMAEKVADALPMVSQVTPAHRDNAVQAVMPGLCFDVVMFCPEKDGPPKYYGSTAQDGSVFGENEDSIKEAIVSLFRARREKHQRHVELCDDALESLGVIDVYDALDELDQED
jgi:hypothetical protein